MIREILNRAARRQTDRSAQHAQERRDDVAELRQQVDVLLQHLVECQRGLVELRRAVSAPTIRALIDEQMGAKGNELRQLSSDVVAILGYLADCAERGEPVTREGLNDVIRQLRESPT